MISHFYELGTVGAFVKLGLSLEFDTPEEAIKHYQSKSTIQKVTGLAGNVAGGIAGGTLGSVGGLGGTIAGGVAGSALGEKAVGAVTGLGKDVLHDIPKKTRSTYRGALTRLNTASGLPSGLAARPRRF